LFVSILMDPTAQDNNQKEDQNPSSAAGKTPQNPILPGQYVVAQDEKSQQNQQFAPPPPPPTEPVSVPQTPLADLGHDRDLVTPATAQDVDLSKAINQQLAGPSTPPQSVPLYLRGEKGGTDTGFFPAHPVGLLQRLLWGMCCGQPGRKARPLPLHRRGFRVFWLFSFGCRSGRKPAP